MSPQLVQAAVAMRAEGKTTWHIAAVLGVGESVVRRALTMAAS